MSEGGKTQRPGTPSQTTGGAQAPPAYVPRDSSVSVSGALARFAGQPIRRKAEPGAEAKGDEKEAEVSQPGEPAEQEADATADKVAGDLHGGDEEKDKKGGKDKEKKDKGKDGDKADAKDADGEDKGEADKDGAEKEGDAEAKADEKPAPISAKLEGVGRKIYAKNPPAANPAAGGAPQNSYKAKKVGAGFEGDFANFANWNKYPPSTASPHPANKQLGCPNATAVPQPAGKYTVVAGQGTGGAGTFRDSWRAELTKQKDAQKQKLQQNFQKKSPGQPLPRGQFEPEAKKAVEAQHKMGWMELWLDGWEGHHIQPVNWSGGDVIANVQFIKCAEHYPFNTWWDAKKSEILALL